MLIIDFVYNPAPNFDFFTSTTVITVVKETFSKRKFFHFFILMLQHPLRSKQLELVGLEEGSSGRTCGIHTVCGELLIPGTHVKLVEASREVIEQVVVEVPIVEESNGSPIQKKRGRPKKPKTRKETQIQRYIEDGFAAYIWINGLMTCRVGFVARSFVVAYGPGLQGRIVEITQLLKECQWEIERKRSADSFGIALGTIIG